MSAVFRHTLGILSPSTEVDAHGNDRLVYPDLAEPSYGWAVDTTGTQEDTDARRGTVNRLTVRRRGEPVVSASDRIVWSGAVYEIEGGVQYQPGPTSLTSHTILALKLAEG